LSEPVEPCVAFRNIFARLESEMFFEADHDLDDVTGVRRLRRDDREDRLVPAS